MPTNLLTGWSKGGKARHRNCRKKSLTVKYHYQFLMCIVAFVYNKSMLCRQEFLSATNTDQSCCTGMVCTLLVCVSITDATTAGTAATATASTLQDNETVSSTVIVTTTSTISASTVANNYIKARRYFTVSSG
jgi:hypothetical protein